MQVNIGDIPLEKSIDDYPDDTVFILNDKPVKYDFETGKRIHPDDPRYDGLPLIDISTGKTIES